MSEAIRPRKMNLQRPTDSLNALDTIVSSVEQLLIKRDPNDGQPESGVSKWELARMINQAGQDEPNSLAGIAVATNRNGPLETSHITASQRRIEKVRNSS